eukprot:2059180-Pyramimonas_sp.AAC.1
MSLPEDLWPESHQGFGRSWSTSKAFALPSSLVPFVDGLPLPLPLSPWVWTGGRGGAGASKMAQDGSKMAPESP